MPSAPSPRRAGRPRRDGRTPAGDPTEAILAATGRLLGEHGLEGTTMSRLAAAVGLGQSSLYYWFSNRDEVVAALVARANVVPLALIAEVEALDAPVPDKLHRFVAGDVTALCALPFDINEVHRLAGRDRSRFVGYWAERADLERRLGALVAQGIEDGSLRAVDPRLTALTIMANDEGVQNWWRADRRPGPVEVGRSLADLVVAGLAAPGRLT